ncbi:MAG: hypothetical protein SVW57_09120 [Thermodesulfobacteriota bacterium]|nr:hypothetical protein [Thermodesulfobacteriota bacterium]
MEKKSNKLAIVGCSDSRGTTPFEDESFEIWGVNNLFHHIPRWDKWFEIHRITHNGLNFLRRGELNFRGESVDDYLKGIDKLNCPVYMQREWPEIKQSVKYPLKEIIGEFGNYFTNTISYMIALGIYEKYEEIHIYGVDMAVDTEYQWQRPSCEYFIGLAEGRGIKTYLPPESDLIKTRFLYGFEETELTSWNKKMKNMKKAMIERLNKSTKQKEEAYKKEQQYIGALEAVKEIDKVWK